LHENIAVVQMAAIKDLHATLACNKKLACKFFILFYFTCTASLKSEDCTRPNYLSNLCF